MRGLLHQLSELDSDAEAAVGWIASFDQLIARHADLNEIVRSAAGLTGSVAGMCDGRHAINICVGPDGRDIDAPASAEHFTSRAQVGDDQSIHVWLQRGGGAHAHDELVVERMAFAVAVTLDRMFMPREQVSGANALEELIDATLDETERRWAAQLLCVEHVDGIRVLALAQDEDGLQEPSVPVRELVRALQAHGEIARVIRTGTVAIVVTTASSPEIYLAEGLRCGIGTMVDVLQAPESWSQAQAVLRFTLAMPGMKVSNYASCDEHGGMVALTMTPRASLLAMPEVVALELFARSSTGRDSIEALDSYVRNGSMRSAASELFLHHTSVAGRLDHASDALGFVVTDPSGMFRAKLALTNWQLSRSTL